jgi:hypothetical protein
MESGSDSDSHEECYDDVENDPAVMHIVRKEEMLQKGLLVVRYDGNMLNRCGKETNKKRFKNSYGVSPATMCKIYIDLQRSDAEDATMNPPIVANEYLRTNLLKNFVREKEGFARVSAKKEGKRLTPTTIPLLLLPESPLS